MFGSVSKTEGILGLPLDGCEWLILRLILPVSRMRDLFTFHNQNCRIKKLLLQRYEASSTTTLGLKRTSQFLICIHGSLAD
jgi:hypothetical protein